MYTKGHLLLVVPLYLITLRSLSNHNLLLSPFLALLCIISMIGAMFPDFDWWIQRNMYSGFGHRNPLFHSCIIPIILYFLMQSIDIFQIFFIETSFQAFVLGVSSHLFGDLIRTGNLVWITGRRFEKWWLMGNGLILILLLFLNSFLSHLQNILEIIW